MMKRLCPFGFVLFCSTFIVMVSGSGKALANEPVEKEGKDQPMKASENVRYPKDFFPLMTWDGFPKTEEVAADTQYGLRSIRECGFTTAGFVSPEQVLLCEQLGLTAIVRGPVSRKEWLELPEDQVDGVVRELIEMCPQSDALLGYFIIDEPGASMFPKLAKAVEAVKKYAPGKLAYINLFPNYATLGAPDTSQLQADSYEQYLERFVEEVKPQFLSYDNYRVQYSNDLDKKNVAASYFTNLLETRKVALRHGLPFWHIVSSNQIRPFTTVPSPANLLMQAYTTLAAGAKGLTWYTYYPRGYGYAPLTKSNQRTATWTYLQMVNQQIKTLGPIMFNLKNTGVFFTSPLPVDGLPQLPGRLAARVESETPVMLGEFSGDSGEHYILVVNLSLEQSAKVVIHLQEGFQAKGVVSPADGSLITLDQEGLWLVAGQGMLIEIG